MNCKNHKCDADAQYGHRDIDCWDEAQTAMVQVPVPTERVRRIAEEAWRATGGYSDDVYEAVRAAGYTKVTAHQAACWAFEALDDWPETPDAERVKAEFEGALALEAACDDAVHARTALRAVQRVSKSQSGIVVAAAREIEAALEAVANVVLLAEAREAAARRELVG